MTGKAMQFAQPTLNATTISANYTADLKHHRLYHWKDPLAIRPACMHIVKVFGTTAMRITMGHQLSGHRLHRLVTYQFRLFKAVTAQYSSAMLMGM